LPASKPIELEAIENAVEKPLADGVTAFVPPPEYLMLMAIDLRRPKDIMRLYQFHSEQVYDPEKLEALLKKHGLTEKWEKILTLFKIQEDT
jgi:alpha-mannosidase